MNNPSGDPPKNNNQGITNKSVQSSAWLYGRMVFTNIINLGVMAVLARQLLPSDFGLVTLAQVLLRFLAVIGSSGVGEYIIYDRAEGREERAHAAFWLNSAVSLVVVVIGLALIPVLTRFYVEPGLAPLLILMFIRYPLDQAANVPDALVKKSLDYKKLVIRDTILEIITSLAMVAMALTGFGVMSLVVPGLAAAPLRFILVIWMARWHPKLPLRLKEWNKIFKYSINVIGTSLATTIAAEGDTLIIGKSLGSAQLGYYNLSWQSANLVSRTITGMVGKVTMPALSAVADDRERLRKAFNRMLMVMGTVSFPLLIGQLVVADLFIITIYGSQWIESILPLQILLIYAIRQSVGSPASVIYNVVGRPEIGLKFNLGFIPFYILSIVIGSLYGIIGVALGVTIARTLGGFVAFWIAARLVKESLYELLKQFALPFSASLIMGLLVWGARILVEQFISSEILVLILLIAFGGIIYLLLLITLYKKLMKELLVLIDTISKPFGNRIRLIMKIG